MSAVDDFKAKFDADGRFHDQDGSLDVVFATKGGGRFSGKLHFRKGLCVRAEMEDGGDWANPDHSPIHGLRFLLNLSGQTLHGVAFDQGRLIQLDEPNATSSKRNFLLNIRVARNLFVHPQKAGAHGSVASTKALSPSLVRAAIWLAPKSVAGFNAADFPELGATRQAELQAAVQSFKEVADQVPSNRPATVDQYNKASVAFEKILEILEPYLPVPDEAKRVESALRDVEFPPWIVNWDYELGSDSDDVDAVWVSVFADEQPVPKGLLGHTASDLTSKVRQAFDDKQICRWPYIRMRSALEHKVG